MARWTPSLHPRAANGRFRSKGGAASGRRRRTPTHELPLRQIRRQGNGYDQVPNRREVRQAIVQSTLGGGVTGLTVAGPKGAAIGALLGGGTAAASIARRTRNTRRRVARTGR